MVERSERPRIGLTYQDANPELMEHPMSPDPAYAGFIEPYVPVGNELPKLPTFTKCLCCTPSESS